MMIRNGEVTLSDRNEIQAKLLDLAPVAQAHVVGIRRKRMIDGLSRPNLIGPDQRSSGRAW